MHTDIVPAFRTLAGGVYHDGRVILMILRAAILSTVLHTLYSIIVTPTFIAIATFHLSYCIGAYCYTICIVLTSGYLFEAKCTSLKHPDQPLQDTQSKKQPSPVSASRW